MIVGEAVAVWLSAAVAVVSVAACAGSSGGELPGSTSSVVPARFLVNRAWAPCPARSNVVSNACWISALGTYNEHLIRDYAAAELGFAVLLVAAAVWFEQRLVLVAGAAFLAAWAWNVSEMPQPLPHHATASDRAGME